MLNYFKNKNWHPYRNRTAYLFAFYYRFIKRYEYEICGKCGKPVEVVWSCHDTAWDIISIFFKGVLCIHCFDSLALRIKTNLTWKVDEVWFNGTKQEL